MTIKEKKIREKLKKAFKTKSWMRKLRSALKQKGKKEGKKLVIVMEPEYAGDAHECGNQSHLVTCKRNLHLFEPLQMASCSAEAKLHSSPQGWHSMGCNQPFSSVNIVLFKSHPMDVHLQTQF